jgi:hypothetical protein
MSTTHNPMTTFTGIYRGVVVDNGLGIQGGGEGRIKVFVPGIHDLDWVKNHQYDNIPWAEPAMSITHDCGDENGIFTVPAVNAIVWLFFEGADHLKPIYFAVTPNASKWAAKRPGVSTFKTNGTCFVLDESSIVAQNAANSATGVPSHLAPLIDNATPSPAIPASTGLPGLSVTVTVDATGMAHVTAIISGSLTIMCPVATINCMPLI